MRALICHQAQPQWKTLCIKPQTVFLMQRMSSRGMALHLVGICSSAVYISLHGAVLLDWQPCCSTLGCGKQHSCAVSRSYGSSWV